MTSNEAILNIDEATLNRIADPIIKEKCILILGPNVSLTDPKQTINQLLKEHIENKLGDSVIRNYFSDDEFFQFNDDDDENTSLGLISDFFKQRKPSDIQQKIAEIPFHVIISTSPDRMLVDLFQQNSYNHNYSFYNQKGENKDLEKPDKNKPLLYNLFGDVDKTESIVYTYDQLFEYLEAIFSKQDLPATLKSVLNDETNYILFIGFRYEKWYFKLLLRLLKLYKIRSKYGSRQDPSIQIDLIRNFYTEEFKVKFVDYDEATIIGAIHRKCNELGILRGKSAPVANTTSPPVYISYAWGGEEVVVDKLYDALTEKGYNLIRDKKTLEYKSNIEKFMDLIGAGAYIIVVVSDKYLKSKNCMYEMQSIYKNNNIQKRIFPIVMEDAKIYDAASRVDYTVYWQNEKANLQKKYNELEDKSYTSEILIDLDNYDDFRRIISEITRMLSYMNTLTPAMHEGENFSELMLALDKQMKEDKSK